jgi:hypothetical protein
MLATINTSGQMSGSSPVLFAATASFVANAQTASFVALAQSASNAVSAQTASFANAFTVASTLTAQTLVVQTITSSVVYSSGSNIFGNNIANTQTFTGSMNLTGSLTVITTGTELQVTSTGVNLGNALTDTHNITGSLRVTGSITSQGGFILGNSATIAPTGSIGYNNAIGVFIYGKSGSEADFRLYNRDGLTAMSVIAGTQNISFNGSVAIGTSNTPTNKLTISNDGNSVVAFRINDTNANASFLSLNASNTDSAIIAGGTSAIPFDIYTGGAARMRITSGGLVLIGTSTLGSGTGVSDLLTIGKSNSSSTGINFTDGTSNRWGFIYINNAKTVYGSFSDTTFETGGSATERMRITSGGNVGIGVTPSSWATITPIQIKNASFAGYSTGTTHILYAGSNFYYDGSGDKYISNGHASLFSQALGEHNWSSSPNNSSGAGASLTLTANMKLSQPGDLYLYNGAFQQQGVWTVLNTGYTSGASSFSFDVGVGDEGGGGNIFKVEAGFAHYYGMAYNCLAEFYVTTRGVDWETTDVIRRDTSLAGSFTASKPNSTTLRVTKNAGNYGGGGRYWIKITKVNY